jgi:hypothetical protein
VVRRAVYASCGYVGAVGERASNKKGATTKMKKEKERGPPPGPPPQPPSLPPLQGKPLLVAAWNATGLNEVKWKWLRERGGFDFLVLTELHDYGFDFLDSLPHGWVVAKSERPPLGDTGVGVCIVTMTRQARAATITGESFDICTRAHPHWLLGAARHVPSVGRTVPPLRCIITGAQRGYGTRHQGSRRGGGKELPDGRGRRCEQPARTQRARAHREVHDGSKRGPQLTHPEMGEAARIVFCELVR